MKIRPLILDENAKAAAAKVVAYAEEHRLELREILRRAGNPTAYGAVGDDPNFTCTLHLGYRCAFSIEQQPGGWMRHLSVSVDEKGVGPSVPAMTAIMALFGFTCDALHADAVQLEKGDYLAVNVLQKITP